MINLTKISAYQKKMSAVPFVIEPIYIHAKIHKQSLPVETDLSFSVKPSTGTDEDRL